MARIIAATAARAGAVLPQAERRFAFKARLLLHLANLTIL
jgi:hypothetical protein